MGREAERTGEDGRGWERTARSALSLMGDMVAMPVEGVAFYFADIEGPEKEEKIPCRLFTTGDFCVVTLWHLAILPGNLKSLKL